MHSFVLGLRYSVATNLYCNFARRSLLTTASPSTLTRSFHQAQSHLRFPRLLFDSATHAQQSYCRTTLSCITSTIVKFSTVSAMASNGDARYKRKTSPVSINERPPKLLKPELANLINGEVMNGESDMEAGDMEYSSDGGDGLVTATADTAEWQATIEKVVKNVVSIHFCQTCSFDTDPAMSSEATGFVVDAKRGYILTNRHVVGAGPFWGYCIFDNHEEVNMILLIYPSKERLTCAISATFTQYTEILYTTLAYCDSIPPRSSIYS